MLKTIRGDDGKPYINLEDLMKEVIDSKEELEKKLDEGLSEDDDFTVENIEDRIDFLEKLYDSLKTIQSEYYKKILGIE